MWVRILGLLRCPVCQHALHVESFREEHIEIAAEYIEIAERRGLLNDDFNRYIDAGLLLCDGCHACFPITHGLPVVVPYTTPIHSEFASEFAQPLRVRSDYEFPRLEPVSGEQFVMNSFSREWLDYDYDGVLWDLSYEDHEKRFLAELGPRAVAHGHGGLFVEIGCGIGMTTFFASKNLSCDALGLDLSLAVLQASKHFRNNPFLHFAQGSAFYLPIRDASAHVLYSHGVLHHTYSTSTAFRSVAPCCRPEGWMYVWLYGHQSERGSVARRIAFWLESTTRPMIARNLSAVPVRVALATLASVYFIINRYHHLRDTTVEKYRYTQALHAARDRFTPLFAHRQDYPEVAGWFQAAGFEAIEQVDWRTMPTANQDNYRRNTGVRGTRSAAATAV